jgi:hypothetical protein
VALRPILTKGLPFSSTPWSAPGEKYTCQLRNWGILEWPCFCAGQVLGKGLEALSQAPRQSFATMIGSLGAVFTLSGRAMGLGTTAESGQRAVDPTRPTAPRAPAPGQRLSTMVRFEQAKARYKGLRTLSKA